MEEVSRYLAECVRKWLCLLSTENRIHNVMMHFEG